MQKGNVIVLVQGFSYGKRALPKSYEKVFKIQFA